MVEQAARERQQLVRRALEPAGEVELGVAGLEERLGEQHAQRLGVADHPAAEHARDLERVLAREAGVGERRRVLGGAEVGLAEHLLVGVGDREPERPAVLGEALEPEPGLLGDLALAVGLVAGEQALDRQQHEAILLHRGAQLVDAAALFVVEVLEQLHPRGTRLVVLEPVEEPLGFPVHVGRDATKARRRAGP